jgi:hypothetical protein
MRPFDQEVDFSPARPQTGAMPDTQPPLPKKRGCFFYGCITSLILLAVVLLGMFLVGRYALNRLNRMVADYTDTSPMALPKSQMPPDQLALLTARVDAFHQAVEAHSNTPPLILTGPEANALLGATPELKAYKDEFFVAFDGEETKAQISLPLDSLPPMPVVNFKGRYLNGSGTFKLAISNGLLSIFVDSLVVKGKPVPPPFLASLQQQNLAQSFNQGTNAAALQQFESVQVKDSVLIVTPKTK